VAEGDLKGRTILVVEDEPLIALDLTAALEDAGARVVQAASAPDAISLVEKGGLSAAVVDFWLGSETGRTVARRLRETDVPFLFYSGRTMDDFTTGRSAPVVSKPAGGKEIIAMLLLLLQQKKRS
jgi:DNA-binding response OmpR family regulator